MKKDFLELKKAYRDAVSQLPISSSFMPTIQHKFIHSVDVLNIGKKILSDTPELKNETADFKIFAEKALLLHDIGRFSEVVMQYKDTLKPTAASSQKYDHGQIGYDLLKQNPLYNDLRILLPINLHNKLLPEIKTSPLWLQAENSPYFPQAKKILILLQDADKLSNLRFTKQKDRLRHDLFFRTLASEKLYAGLSPEVMQQFFSCQVVKLSSIVSFADRILMVLSWIFDLNYQKSKELFQQLSYEKYLLDLLAEYHQNKVDITQIEQFAKQYL